jgi:hypothetical protein
MNSFPGERIVIIAKQRAIRFSYEHRARDDFKLSVQGWLHHKTLICLVRGWERIISPVNTKASWKWCRINVHAFPFCLWWVTCTIVNNINTSRRLADPCFIGRMVLTLCIRNETLGCRDERRSEWTTVYVVQVAWIRVCTKCRTIWSTYYLIEWFRWKH